MNSEKIMDCDNSLKIIGKCFDYRHTGPKPYCAIFTDIFHNERLMFRTGLTIYSWYGKEIKAEYSVQIIKPNGYLWRNGYGVLWWDDMYWDGEQWRSPYEIPKDVVDPYVKKRRPVPRNIREKYRLTQTEIRKRGWIPA